MNRFPMIIEYFLGTLSERMQEEMQPKKLPVKTIPLITAVLDSSNFISLTSIPLAIDIDIVSVPSSNLSEKIATIINICHLVHLIFS